MTLEEWIDKTPGMRQLNRDIACHIESTIDGAEEDRYSDTVRLIMISVRQYTEIKVAHSIKFDSAKFRMGEY